MMLHNYPAIFMKCTAMYLILSTIIHFQQILKCYRACLFQLTCPNRHWWQLQLTKSKAIVLLDLPFVSKEICGTQSIIYNCIKDWINFRNNFPHMDLVLHKWTYTLIKRHLKDYLIGKYWKYFCFQRNGFHVLPYSTILSSSFSLF